MIRHTLPHRSSGFIWALGCLRLLSLVTLSTLRAADGVSLTELDGKLRIEVGGQLFTEYHYQDVSRPFFYPVLGPSQLPMTRDWPMKDTTPGEERDHKHHRSLWWAHGDINGHDFWSEEPGACKTFQVKLMNVQSGPTVGSFQTQDEYRANDGTVVATDDRHVRIYNHPNDRVLDFDITIHASNGPVTFGDTKEGTMAIRLNESMRLERRKQPGLGHIVTSEGVRDGQTWGKRAKWCDYYGPVEGQTVGVAIFDHPSNPRHPTWWHVREYGLFAANPFGLHYFEGKPKGAGKLVVPAGQSITFRYRFYFHRGDEHQGHVAERYEAYAHEPAEN